MRIGIEGKVLTRRIGGIGRYAINLVKALLSLSAQEHPDMEFVIFTAPQTDRGILDGLGAVSCDRFRRVKSSLLRSSFLLPAGVFLERIDVFHGLDQSGIPLFLKKGKYVVTLHDVITLTLPRAFPLKRRLVLTAALSRIRRQADRVIVPSEAAGEDVVRYLKVDRGKIIVIPWGCEQRFQASGDRKRLEKVRRRYGLPDRYALFLGTLEPRKNVTTLVKAFSLLTTKLDQNLKLVITGDRGWGYEGLFKTIEALGLHDHVLFTGFVNDEDLPDLYRGALLFVYPSLYEGFGLPILEAMASGVPVIASNTSSMPEVAEDAAILVDPHDPEALASAMAMVLTNEELREELRQKGIARARRFSWEAVARKTLEVYQAL
ncbi:MAG: glycosyltransferase family 4 protein [Candidatus Methylomirabilales bacterium]